jgi:hypothetical protein
LDGSDCIYVRLTGFGKAILHPLAVAHTITEDVGLESRNVWWSDAIKQLVQRTIWCWITGSIEPIGDGPSELRWIDNLASCIYFVRKRSKWGNIEGKSLARFLKEQDSGVWPDGMPNAQLVEDIGIGQC